ncbi:exodeoxyribonuclease VII small subunit [bacterium]|nr:exodeoxyribonuclease VII small subunit [bacterium]
MLLKRLEEIVNTMESGGLSLDESLKLYEEGVKKADKLTAMLAEARNRVMKLVGDKNGGAVLESFEEEDIS